MAPWTEYHASIAVHCEVQSYSVQVLIHDVSNNSGFDFGEGSATSVLVGARVVAGADGVPEEVIISIAVDSRTSYALSVLVGGTGLAPETVLKNK